MTPDTLMAGALKKRVLTEKGCLYTLLFFKSSPIAQLVEQMTVNHWVRGSSPRRGATSTITTLSSLHLR